MEAPNAVQTGDGNLRQIAAQPGLQGKDLGCRFHGDRVDHQPTARSQPIDAGVDNTRIARAATNEDRIGIWKRLEAGGRLGFDHAEIGNTEGQGIASDAGGARRILFDGAGA